MLFGVVLRTGGRTKASPLRLQSQWAAAGSSVCRAFSSASASSGAHHDDGDGASTNGNKKKETSAAGGNGGNIQLDSHALKPSEVVAELDRHIVGQHDAKRAVANAMRNRWRRRQLPEDLRKEVTPRNVLLVGPTGALLLFV
jgi:hypothetical protein